jgi:hypothetical protein
MSFARVLYKPSEATHWVRTLGVEQSPAVVIVKEGEPDVVVQGMHHP